MDLIHTFVDYVLHLDAHLATLVSWAGVWTYVVLALIIFCETGLVVTPFLPGDSLLFATGALAAATGSLSIVALFVLLTVCAILGDAVNYWLGSRLGAQAAAGRLPLVKKEHIQRTHEFYERHGGKTIILARFVPIIRTFAPFVAGAGTMSYQRFAAYNISGGVAWVGLMLFAGYFFGNIPVVKDNFSLVVLAIIILSIIPGVVAVWQERQRILAERAAR
ncbi:MAG TPA: DedA family protein [Gemmatimonadaceae bacterium]|mgnify:CR=1 FL=1|jgi:membrane-associated protein|nr:DedA family protein [Gemmatimonadota bacterium]HNV76098.1 DedA family protein [Gemmatimonadaceae bacterium]MBK6841722.1 DedA family protein [Gemmatimonadota bacterium]MBK7835424.1 DedA family protein [Gemmatimonadota bacterium]MBK8061816.1 DedA family protein [Gemmatimonadota bacterium]